MWHYLARDLQDTMEHICCFRAEITILLVRTSDRETHFECASALLILAKNTLNYALDIGFYSSRTLSHLFYSADPLPLIASDCMSCRYIRIQDAGCDKVAKWVCHNLTLYIQSRLSFFSVIFVSAIGVPQVISQSYRISLVSS